MHLNNWYIKEGCSRCHRIMVLCTELENVFVDSCTAEYEMLGEGKYWYKRPLVHSFSLRWRRLFW